MIEYIYREEGIMKSRQLLIGLLYIAIAAAVVFAVVSTKGFGYLDKKSSASKSGWQAVFLSNGQVYFGHLTDQSSQFATLTDIYYLQVDQQTDLQKGKDTTAQQPKLTLIKLGNELHGPVDKMTLNRDHVLFIEDMKSDSKVVTAISDYKKNPNPAPAAN